MHQLNITTRARVEFQDITLEIANLVRKSGVRSGVCRLFVPHTTAGITINEHADPDVIEDIKAQLEAMVPRHGGYRHAEGNSPAHIKASLMGCSLALLIGDGDLVLGTWQGIFFCEFDGPRHRQLFVKIVPDKV
jgi:secondary thiamine-phosphate synthase enzyme